MPTLVALVYAQSHIAAQLGQRAKRLQPQAGCVVQAGTYGVLVLFGVLPAAMVWRERFALQSASTRIRAVPGGRPVLLAVGGFALAIIVHEMVTTAGQLLGSEGG